MAQVYSPPQGYEPPSFFDYTSSGGDYKEQREKYDKAEREFVEKLRLKAKENQPGDLVGEIVRFGAGDGYAQYMVWSQRPLQLIYLKIGDGWQIPEAHARGLRLADIKKMVESERKLNKLFKRERLWP